MLGYSTTGKSEASAGEIISAAAPSPDYVFLLVNRKKIP